jgi:conjugative transfer signal peptidase TraF
MMGGRSDRLCRMALTAAVTITVAFGLPAAFSIRINLSPSLPIGLYRVTADRNAALVEFCPPEPYATLARERRYRTSGACPDGAMPLMKPVVAATGDLVELSSRGIAVNGALLPNTAPRTRDGAGRQLSAWPYGKYEVGPEIIWVASTYDPRSFDSRYFGPIKWQHIRCRLSAIITDPSKTPGR